MNINLKLIYSVYSLTANRFNLFYLGRKKLKRSENNYLLLPGTVDIVKIVLLLFSIQKTVGGKVNCLKRSYSQPYHKTSSDRPQSNLLPRILRA